jgi:hypothetical protein
MTDLHAVYRELRNIFAPFRSKLETKVDHDAELYLDTFHIQKNKKPLFFGAVQLKKSNVSFHLMPVYLEPSLLDSLSPALKARMQGKSCFNFTNIELGLFKELGRLTQSGFESYRKQGFVH